MKDWFRFPPSVSVGQLLFTLFGLSLVLGLALLFTISSGVKSKVVGDIAEDEARKMSQLVFQTLYSAMSKGWSRQDVEEIIARLNENRRELSVSIFRGDPVIRQFGDAPGGRADWGADPKLRSAMLDGREWLIPVGDSVRYIYPVKATEKCLSCHTEAKAGEVNGVIDMTIPVSNIKSYLNFALNGVIGSFTVVLTLVFLALFILLRHFMAGPIMKLEGVIQEITRNTDLKKQISVSNGWVKELESLTSYFNRMLSTLHEYNLQLEELSIRDPLTRLYNRRKFEQMLEIEARRARRNGRPFSVVMLDLDNFKTINDTYGHPAGDIALQELGGLLEKHVRNTDIVSRIGGDEFAIILPDTGIDQGLRVAGKLCDTLSMTDVKLPASRVRMTASFGLVEFPNNGDALHDISISMDIAMYKAKRQGKNRVAVIDLADRKMVTEAYTVGEMVRKALAEDRVEVYLQPIVNMKTGGVFACEALARIREEGMVIEASRFIDAAAELGLARDIDHRVLEKGIDIKLASPELDGVKLFFNLSSQTFCDYEYMRRLPADISMRGVDPKDIVFEVTEREALPHISELAGILEDLTGKGISFALDDFGSGFSSFIYLKYLTVSYIKIEGSFIRGIATQKSDRIMVEHIRGMAAEFGIHAIGECVEDERTHHALAALGVDFGQGIYYASPNPTGRLQASASA